jgi:hypothetical protein
MRRLNWTIVALIAGLILLVLLVAYFATNRGSQQDKLTNAQVATTTTPTHEKLCASNATYNLIKRELFQKAAQLRGGDQAAYDSLAGYAVVRMENPVMESEDSATDTVNCSGSLSLDLPPGVVIQGGRRSLMADVDYTVDPNGNVTLKNADAIIAPLSTLSRMEQPQPETLSREATNEVAPEQPETNVAAPQSANVPPAPRTSYPGRPSFDCSKASGRGEIAVCSDTSLSALDLIAAAQFSRAMTAASPEQQLLLRQTGRRFNVYRDRCPDRQCIADAYVGRMREIRSIMEDRWQPPR